MGHEFEDTFRKIADRAMKQADARKKAEQAAIDKRRADIDENRQSRRAYADRLVLASLDEWHTTHNLSALLHRPKSAVYAQLARMLRETTVVCRRSPGRGNSLEWRRR